MRNVPVNPGNEIMLFIYSPIFKASVFVKILSCIY